jgi:hypothetical protein
VNLDNLINHTESLKQKRLSEQDIYNSLIANNPDYINLAKSYYQSGNRKQTEPYGTNLME